MKLQHAKQNTDVVIQSILIFGPRIGKLEGITATVYLVDNFQPKFFQAGPVPYSIRPKVEEELQRLEKESVIKSVSQSKWASSVVPEVKKNGQVRLCGVNH